MHFHIHKQSDTLIIYYNMWILKLNQGLQDVVVKKSVTSFTASSS